MDLNLGFFDNLDLLTQLNFCLRIIAAAMCGCIIGYERSRRSKGAGVRTHMVIALSSALMMIISKYGFFDMLGTGVNADSTRIAAQIVTSIPFLGAGVIYIRQNHSSVQGLTTAAGILATCGIGMALGAGLYLIAIFATALLMVLQLVLHKILTGYDSSYNGEAILVSNGEIDAAAIVTQQFSEFHVTVQKCRIRRLENGALEYRINFKTTHEIPLPLLTKTLIEHPEFSDIEI